MLQALLCIFLLSIYPDIRRASRTMRRKWAKELVDEAKADGVAIPKLPLTYPSENPI